MRRTLLPAVLLLAAAALLPAPSAAAQKEVVDHAREMLEDDRAEEALKLLDRAVARHPKDAEALLLRSTARFQLDDREGGRKDLERALELDPNQRQGWLHLAGLAVADERYDAALEAFRQAERIDPTAPDNDLNVGAVLLLQGQLQPASERFSRYLAGAGDSAEGHFLVAKNYALAGYAALAVETLRTAIERDERARVQAKSDAAFRELNDHPRYRDLMVADTYRPPLGTHRASRDFAAAYTGGRGPLLRAVLDTLQLGGHPFDSRVEVTEEWALLWGEARIKVSDTAEGGRIELTAPPGRFGADEWSEYSDTLFRAIAGRLATRR
ncbi:MAG TPA: tetratricopeptide repeat protein [Thermoanaerobaculia bacterium]|nr:tetratricopeptide repeat protein [Thermoanaerobaculia bacterium]